MNSVAERCGQCLWLRMSSHLACSRQARQRVQRQSSSSSLNPTFCTSSVILYFRRPSVQARGLCPAPLARLTRAAVAVRRRVLWRGDPHSSARVATLVCGRPDAIPGLRGASRPTCGAAAVF